MISFEHNILLFRLANFLRDPQGMRQYHINSYFTDFPDVSGLSRVISNTLLAL